MSDEIVVLRRADLEVIMEGVVGRVLQGLALSLSGGAAAAAALASPQKVRARALPLVGETPRLLELTAGGKPAKKGKREQGRTPGRVIVDVDEPGDWIGVEDATRLLGYTSQAAVFYQANKGALRVKHVPSESGKGASHRTMFDRAEIMALKRAKNGGPAPRASKQQLPLPEVATSGGSGWADSATASKISKLSVPTLLRAANAGTVTARHPNGNQRLWEFDLRSVLAAVSEGRIVPRKKRKKK